MGDLTGLFQQNLHQGQPETDWQEFLPGVKVFLFPNPSCRHIQMVYT